MQRAIVAELAFQDLAVGMCCRRTFRFTEERVAEFAALVNDAAPVHTDAAFAKARGFETRIVHGLFVQSILSGMLGNELPGAGSVINSLTMNMHLPVAVGTEVEYLVEITALTAAVSAVSLKYSGTTAGQLVISGKAICSFPASRPR